MRSFVRIAGLAVCISGASGGAACGVFGESSTDAPAGDASTPAPPSADGGDASTPPDCAGGTAFRIDFSQGLPDGFTTMTSAGGSVEPNDGMLRARVDLGTEEQGYAFLERFFDLPPRRLRFEARASFDGPVRGRYVEPVLEVGLLGAEETPRTQLYFYVFHQSPTIFRFQPYSYLADGSEEEDQVAKRNSEVLRQPFTGPVGVSLDLARVPAAGTARILHGNHDFSTTLAVAPTRVRVRVGIILATRAEDVNAPDRTRPFEVNLQSLVGEICP
jgi:hypothetical protein